MQLYLLDENGVRPHYRIVTYNCYYLQLHGLTGDGRRVVVRRIMENLEREGLYSVLNMNVDASVLDEEREAEIWYPIAV